MLLSAARQVLLLRWNHFFYAHIFFLSFSFFYDFFLHLFILFAHFFKLPTMGNHWVFADNLASSVQTTINCNPLLANKVISRMFLVQHPQPPATTCQPVGEHTFFPSGHRLPGVCQPVSKHCEWIITNKFELRYLVIKIKCLSFLNSVVTKVVTKKTFFLF